MYLWRPGLQEELYRLRDQLQHNELVPSSALLAEELALVREELEAKELMIRDMAAGKRGSVATMYLE